MTAGASDSKSIIPSSYITRLERSDNKNHISYRLSSRNSFSSSLRSSHILSIKITNHLSLVASLLAPSHHPSARYSQDYPLDVPSPLLLGGRGSASRSLPQACRSSRPRPPRAARADHFPAAPPQSSYLPSSYLPW